jgi:hypothetical protein
MGPLWPYIRSYVMKDGHLFLSLMADGGIYEFEPAEPSPQALHRRRALSRAAVRVVVTLEARESARGDDGVVAARHAQVHEDLQVPLDRLNADVERERDALVRYGTFEQRKDLDLRPPTATAWRHF